MPSGCSPGFGCVADVLGGVVPSAQSGSAASCRAMRPLTAPPLSTNQWASAIRRSTSVPGDSGVPSSRPSARRIRTPDAARSTRKSAGAACTVGVTPASIAKPTLPGRSGSSDSRARNALAMRWVSSPSCQSGATRMLARASRTGSGSMRASFRSSSISGRQMSSRTPRIWRLARVVASISPLPCSAAALHRPSIWARVRRPNGGRTRTSSPSPAIIGRHASGHQPLTMPLVAPLVAGAFMPAGPARRGSSCGGSATGPLRGGRRSAPASPRARRGWLRPGRR